MSASPLLPFGAEPEPETRVSRMRRRVIEAALAIEQEDARQAGMLAFVAWIFCQVGLPHRAVPESQWLRNNGAVRLCILADPRIGLPYGRLCRLILCYVTTEAKRTSQPRVELGRSVSSFLHRLDIGYVNGGERGSLRYVREQLRRLFTATVSATLDIHDDQEHLWENSGFRLSDNLTMCWSKHPDQEALWTSHVDLSDRFFRMATERVIPVDLRAIRALRSPLAIDLLVWLSVRCTFLREAREIPWNVLELQFGANYESTHEFRRNVLRQLPDVLRLHPAVRVTTGRSGLILKPSRPHVVRAEAVEK